MAMPRQFRTDPARRAGLTVRASRRREIEATPKPEPLLPEPLLPETAVVPDAVRRQSSGTASGARFIALDGMRAIAALMVVAYHHFFRWAPPDADITLYAYGALFADFVPLALAGKIGVFLFFVISGFVIVMTLDRCAGVKDFALRRVIRLWPAALICASLTTLVLSLAGVIAPKAPWPPEWGVTPAEFISSVFFIPPKHLGGLVGQPDALWVDGVYWTLWAEVRFYGVAALIYFTVRRDQFIAAWTLLQAMSLAYKGIITLHPSWAGAFFLEALVQPDHLSWFTFGVCGYVFFHEGFARKLVAPLALALASLFVGDVVSYSAADGFIWGPRLPSTIAILFAVAVPIGLFLSRSRLLAPLEHPWIVTIGLASYPLYLLHQYVGIILARGLADRGFPPIPAALFIIVLIIIVSVGIFQFVEEPVRRYFRPHLRGRSAPSKVADDR